MLCISTKGRYATRILVLLACQARDATLTKHEIADSEGLTPGYVQQLMTPLQAAGLVTSYRGKQGGFKLARSGETITLVEVLRVMEGAIRLVPCHDGENCDRITNCATRPVWMEAAALLNDFFRQITIADLAERAKELAGAPEEVAIASGTAPAGAEEKGVRP
jgi:Rrf2 family protein